MHTQLKLITMPFSRYAQLLLCTDSSAGILVGITLLAGQSWLEPWYGLSDPFLTLIGLTNLVYGLASGALLLWTSHARRLSRKALRSLALANRTWGLVACALCIYTWSEATWLGSGHLLLEAVFVCALAQLELRLAVQG